MMTPGLFENERQYSVGWIPSDPTITAAGKLATVKKRRLLKGF